MMSTVDRVERDEARSARWLKGSNNLFSFFHSRSRVLFFPVVGFYVDFNAREVKIVPLIDSLESGFGGKERTRISLARQLGALLQMLIDMLCRLRMLSVSSSHALVFYVPGAISPAVSQRSPGALRRPPHIKASLISAALIATHPMIINLGLLCVCECAHTPT